jgi:integrase/recombinase XerD
MGLTITKKSGSPNWYIRGTVKGVSIFESTGIPHANKSRPPQIVEDYRDSRVSEIQDQKVYGRSHTATFLDAAVLYLETGGSPRFLGTLDPESGRWSGLVGKIGDKRLKDLDQGSLNRAASELYPKCSAQTINRQFWTPFIAVWKNASKGNNPLCQEAVWQRPRITRKSAPRAAVDYQQVITFINGCDWHAAKILFFLFWTGCRPEEAFLLTTENVFPVQNWAAITATKTDVPRGIPLHPALLPLLKIECERPGHVFLNDRGTPYASRKKYNAAGRLMVQGGGQIKTAVRTAREATGIEIVPYNARHTVSTYLIWPGGVNPHVKDEILGHADADDMSKYYVHLPRQPLIDAIKVLPDPRKMGLREDLWKPSKIRTKSSTAYRKIQLKQEDS